jgi:hypothetical protein
MNQSTRDALLDAFEELHVKVVSILRNVPVIATSDAQAALNAPLHPVCDIPTGLHLDNSGSPAFENVIPEVIAAADEEGNHCDGVALADDIPRSLPIHPAAPEDTEDTEDGPPQVEQLVKAYTEHVQDAELVLIVRPGRALG